MPDPIYDVAWDLPQGIYSDSVAMLNPAPSADVPVSNSQSLLSCVELNEYTLPVHLCMPYTVLHSRVTADSHLCMHWLARLGTYAQYHEVHSDYQQHLTWQKVVLDPLYSCLTLPFCSAVGVTATSARAGVHKGRHMKSWRKDMSPHPVVLSPTAAQRVHANAAAHIAAAQATRKHVPCGPETGLAPRNLFIMCSVPGMYGVSLWLSGLAAVIILSASVLWPRARL